MTVWDGLVGQGRAVETLSRASREHGHAMTHAWLITGPPGSGRSNAARSFAAALQCTLGTGCGQCQACRTSLSGAHPDVHVVRTEQLSIGVAEVRDLVRRAAMSPTTGRHQVIIVEDADRVTERGADAMLKAIEEPAPRTVWLLCAPTADDVIVTIRSRCRHLHLVTPTQAEVAALLVARDGVDPALAAYAARVAQGHIGRARALALNEDVRARRRESLLIPAQLTTLGACLRSAQSVVEATAQEAAAVTSVLDEKEKSELSEALGFGTRGARPRNASSLLKELDDQQKLRAKRMQRDALDRVLSELTGYYRDVLSVQLDAGVGLINAELSAPIATAARASTPERTLSKIDALLECRTALEANVPPLLAIEALMVTLADDLG